jgi:hypothetical protein
VRTTTVELPADLVAVLQGYVEAAERGGLRGRLRSTRGGAYRREQGAAAGLLLEQGTCLQVQVEHDVAPAVMTHEHGLLLMFPVGTEATHLLEVSSVGDDPRWALHATGDLMRRQWTWLRLGDLGVHDFAATGEQLAPLDLGDFHGTRLEEYLTEGDAGWPGDDASLDVSFNDILAMARQ